MRIVRPAEQVDMARNKRLLNRYRYIEYECLRILAAWLPADALNEAHAFPYRRRSLAN